MLEGIHHLLVSERKSRFGKFVRGERRLLVEFAYSLGPVKYYSGDLWLDHEPYMLLQPNSIETGVRGGSL